MIKLSERAKELIPSATLGMATKAAKLRDEGVDVISFSNGEPDFDTPAYIKDAAKGSLDRGFTKYTPVAGIPKLRDAISRKLSRENRLEYPSDTITVTCGAKQAIANALLAIIDPGDEVIVPAPYWVSYPPQVKLAGGKPVAIDTADSELKLTANALLKALTPKTKALILNSPSNPSGVVYSKEELASLAKVCVERNIAVISDEIYEYLLFSDGGHVSIVNAYEEVKPLTIIVNGVSKGFSMTGWRLGWASGPKEIITKMSQLAGQQTTSPASFVQEAAISALDGPRDEVMGWVEQFKVRRDAMQEHLSSIPGVSCHTPMGAFYHFPNMSSFGDDLALAELLLTKGHIATVAGTPFGAPGYLRISFATSLEKIDEGMQRLKSVLNDITRR
jgi:aspartate aminotransferase